MKYVNKLENERLLIYKQSRQYLGLCDDSFARYLEKGFTRIYTTLHGGAKWRPISIIAFCQLLL